MSNEVWRPIVGFEGVYSVSDRGRVRNEERRAVNSPDGRTRRVRERILKQRPDGSGYLLVWLMFIGNRTPAKVASLVARAFIGEKESPRLEVCHNDGKKTNNAASNLRYDTRVGNMADCVNHGTISRGEKQGRAKLTGRSVMAIRSDARTLEEIGKEYGISFQHVSAIKRRRCWAHI